jgi:HK97 family phage prohead protease
MKDRIAIAHRAFKPELRDTDLPDGVIGQVAGIALVYDVVDDHGTIFSRGCLDRTRREKVASGKVRLYWDHGDSLSLNYYDSDLHIGTVRSLDDVTLSDGRMAAYMVADLLDVPKAHEVKQYLASVLASGGETGLSVGFKERKTAPSREGTRFLELELREISVTSMQSVPDSGVLAVRAEINRPSLEAALDALLRMLPPETVRARVSAVIGNANADDSDATGRTPGDSDADAQDSRSGKPEFATMEERLFALRRTYV